MFRIYDPRTGQLEPVKPARRGQLHTYLAGPDNGWILPRDLRSALVADLIRRVAVRHRLRVVAWQGWPGAGVPGAAQRGAAAGGSPEVAWRAAWEDLNIYPAQFSAQLPDTLDLAIAACGTAGDNGTAGDRVGAAGGQRVTEHQPAVKAGAHWVWPAAVLPNGEEARAASRRLDPLALRLAFLRQNYRRPASLSRDSLTTADRSLREWRQQVADWACSPSKRMSAQYVGDVTAALDDDLDAPAALGTLQALADDSEIPPGSKFEAFAYLDQLLGLDLVREVGR